MKTPSTFWPVLRNELALFRYGYPGWWTAGGLAIVGAVFIELFLLIFQEDRIGNNLAMLLETNIFFIVLAMVLMPLMLVTLLATVPALSEFHQINSPTGAKAPLPIPPLGTMEGLEFMFTRAMNRVMFYRARNVAFFILALAPFYIILATAPFAPDLHLNLNHTPADRLDAQIALYYQAFSAMHPLVDSQRRLPNQFIVPHGAVTYALWLLCITVLVLSLCRAYGMLVSRWVNPNRWWTLTPLLIPFVVIVRLLVITFRVQERSFLFFAAHLLPMIAALIVLTIVIELWCEHRFRQIEIL